MDQEWSQLQRSVVEEIQKITINRAEPPTSLRRMSSINIKVPEVTNEQEEIPQLKKHLTHIWILIHDRNVNIKGTRDYQEFMKMYEKSKYLLKRFSVNINKIEDCFYQFRNTLNLSIKCFVHADLIVNDNHWENLKPYLEDDLVNEIIVKSSSQIEKKREEERRKCQVRFQNDFGERQQRYCGFVQNFNDAMQLQKKILNLAMSKLKPNFFIINEYETLAASNNLNSFHDILINTKAYLKESFDIKSKQKVQNSLNLFKNFIYSEFQQYYQLLEKQRKPGFEDKKQKERNILDTFFSFATETISNQYPFERASVEERFYNQVVILYTQETVVYTSVNNLCKTVTSKQMFMKIAFFCKFLNLAIKMKGKNEMQNHVRVKNYYEQTFYRGAMMSQIQWQSLIKMAKINGYIINLAFTSTSLSQDIALKFYKNNVRNNILIKIKINKLFWSYCNRKPYCNYIEYYIHNNISGLSAQSNQEEVIFNCYNVFKVIGNENDENSRRVLILEAFSHLEIIQRKQNGKQITEQEEKILDVIVRIEKDKDYASQLKQQGKTQEMVTYLEKVVENGVDLSVNQAQTYIQFMVQNGKQASVEILIGKIQEQSENTIEQEMKLAVYQSIKEEYLQTQVYLQSIERMLQSQNIIGWESWTQLMNRSHLKHAVSVNKEKIGAYEECFSSLQDNIENHFPLIRISEFIENIQTWRKFYQFLIRNDALERYSTGLKEKKQRFDILYEIIKNQLNGSKQKSIEEIKNDISEFLTLDTEAFFFLSIFQSLQKKEFFHGDNQLRRDLQSCKNQFYERSQLKVKILIYYYQLLIKRQRIEIFKPQEEKQLNIIKKTSSFFRNLFQSYFENNRSFFEKLDLIYEKETSDKVKYQRALFLKEYGKFLNGLFYFHKMQDEEKKKMRGKISKVFQTARKNLQQISGQHEELVSIQNIQDNMRQERLFSDKINKIESIYQSLHNSMAESISIEKNEEIYNLAQSLKNSRFQSAKKYNSKNSILNENLCYSSVMNMTMEIVQQSSASSDLKTKYNYDFQKLANKVQSNMNSNVYLKQHTSNAFNNFLRASFQYYKGYYESSMVFIGKSQDILDFKLKSTEERMSSEPDQEKKAILQKKLDTIKQNNEVRIKICVLKSKICINYKPNIHTLCINNLKDQQHFIKEKLFQLNSSLPEIYYFQAYLNLLRENNDKGKLQSAFKILTPQTKRLELKKQLLKYYILMYNIVDGTQRVNTINNIETIAGKYKIAVQNHQSIQVRFIEEHEHYYLFKIEQIANQQRFSFFLMIENILRRNERVTLDKLYTIQRVKGLFESPQSPSYWQIVDKIINLKFTNNILVSYRLFIYYFLYIQILISRQQYTLHFAAIEKLKTLTLKLDIIVENTNLNKRKYGIPIKSNDGYEDKIKIILLHVFKFANEEGRRVPEKRAGDPSYANSDIIIETSETDYERFKRNYFNDI